MPYPKKYTNSGMPLPLYGNRYFFERWPLSPEEKDMKAKLVSKVQNLKSKVWWQQKLRNCS